MSNAKCMTCDRAADAGAYCNFCAADNMAKALIPFHGRGLKKSAPPKPSQGYPVLTPLD